MSTTSLHLSWRVLTMDRLEGYPLQDIMAPGVDQELKAALQPTMLDSSQLRLFAEVLASPARPTVAVDTTLNANDLTLTTDAAGHRRTQLLVSLVAFSTASDPNFLRRE